ncbi:copper resistance CopC/CopD family protein [Streptomyces sp. NPDC101160]|uniref:copper resistance CopC/CopD family protein n=1 Tax=Streptomyces sp. NPDC101160 TaxID=3366118 RepID=UPI0037FD800E
MTTTAPRLGPALARLLLVAAALLGALLATAGPASAHAALTGSDPQDGAVVATAPKEVDLTFSEQVAMSGDSIRVLDPAGKRADTGEIRDRCSGSTVRYGVELLPGLPDGTYTVAWQTVSADSHPVSGAFTFSIGAPSKTSVALPDTPVGGGVVGALYGIARYLSYAAFVVLVGGGAFVLACWPRGAAVRPVQKLVVGGWLTLTGSTLALLLLRHPYTRTGKLADVFDLGGLRAVLETKTGAALSSRLLLLGAAALFVAVLFGAYARKVEERDPGNEDDERDEEGRRDLTFGLALGGVVVAAGIAGTWALAEHASTGLQPGVAMPVDILHLLAVAVWLGGLTALLVALYRAPSVERSAVERYSKVAFGSVVVLAATGIYQSWRQVGTWSALTDTRYGQLLLVKIGLVAVLVAIGWVSRRWVRRLAEAPASERAEEAASERAEEAEEPSGAEAASIVEVNEERAAQLARQRAAVATARRKKARDADPERAGLRRSVLTEAAVAVVLLAVTTVLTATEPARTAEETGRGRAAAGSTAVPNRPIDVRLPFDTGGVDGKGTVQVTLDPGRTGANALHIYVLRPNGRGLDVPEVKVAFTLKEKNIGPLPVLPDRVQTGHWSAAGVQLPMPGEWTMQVTVRTSDIDQTTIEKNVKIG